MDLGQALMDYAVESGEAVAVELPSNDLNDAGATELTVVTDDTRSDLEEALEETAQDVIKLNESNAGAEKLVDAAESLESFMLQLESFEARGIPLDGAASQLFLQGVAVSLEARDIPKELFADDLFAAQASFEALAIGHDGAKGDAAPEAKEKTGNILTRIWNVLKTAVMGAITRLTNWVATIGKSAKAVKASGARLKEVGKGVSGEATGKLKGSSYSALVVGGKVDPSHALSSVESGWTTGVLAVTKDLRAVCTGLVAALSKADAGTIGAFARTIDTKLHKQDHDLTGGYSIKFSPGEGGGLDGVLKAKFAIVKGESPKAGEDFEPLTGPQIVELGGKLEALGTLMEKIATDSSESVRQARSVIDAAKKGADKSGEKGDQAEAKKLFSTAQSLVKQVSSYAPQYVTFMGTVAKQAYALGMASASKHKGGAAAAAPGEKKDDVKAIGKDDTKAIGDGKGDDK
ncbi:hypothetical protein D3C85_159870 [compost metagenome]